MPTVPAHTYATFMANIATLVDKAGSIEEVAAGAGVSFWTVQSWIRGTVRRPTYSSMLRIAEYAETTVEKLMEKRI